MQAELQGLPKLFTRDMVNGFTGVAKSLGTQLMIVAVNPDGTAYENTFSEAALAKIGQTPNWGNYFNSFRTSFEGSMCHISADDMSCRIEVPGCGVFVLPRSVRNGHEFLLTNMASFVKMRTVKDPEKLMKEVNDRERTSRERWELAQKEYDEAKVQLTSLEEEERVQKKRMQEAEAKLAKKQGELEADRSFLSEDAAPVSRARNPLGEEVCREYDTVLLQLVKSYFSTDPAAMAGMDEQYHSVIRPMSSTEYTDFIKNLPTAQSQAVYDALQKLDAWDFNVFALQEAMTGGHQHEGFIHQKRGGSLFIVTYALMLRHDLFRLFNINERIALNWISMVEAGYHPNPYHNSMHAADVLHITHFILGTGGLASKCKLSQEDLFAAFFAAAIHDFNHPGINNNFHIKAQTYLAVLYNDRSVLENLHVSSVFELCKLDCYNILQSFTPEQRKEIYETVVEMVLSTDMGLHGKILSTFKRKISEFGPQYTKEDIRLFLSMALKMADISNCGRPQLLYLQWCDKICDEFYLQGDRERNLGLPCSPFMDRYTATMSKGQQAFINYIVVPLFESVSEFLPEMHFTVDIAEQNKSYWL